MHCRFRRSTTHFLILNLLGKFLKQNCNKKQTTGEKNHLANLHLPYSCSVETAIRRHRHFLPTAHLFVNTHSLSLSLTFGPIFHTLTPKPPCNPHYDGFPTQSGNITDTVRFGWLSILLLVASRRSRFGIDKANRLAIVTLATVFNCLLFRLKVHLSPQSTSMWQTKLSTAC